MNGHGYGAILLLALVAVPSWSGGFTEDPMSLHRSAIVFDAHCDTAMRLVGPKRVNLGVRLEDGHMDLPRMMEGGLDAQIFACWCDPDYPDREWVERTVAMIDAVREQADRHPDSLEVALTGGDVRRIVGAGKVAALIGIEGGHAIVDDLDVLGNYHRLGVRCMTLTWRNTNGWADSSEDTTRWGGLNELGRGVVREMDRLGMIIDCSHVSDSTFFDVLAVTENPVIVSHSCVRALCDIPRNVSDDQLRAIHDNGGVICINFFAGFLEKDYHDRVFAIYDEYRAKRRELAARYGGDRERARDELGPVYLARVHAIPAPGIPILVDHIDHAVRVAGIDHVGLGSDFDGMSAVPEGLDDVSCLPRITEELERRGYGRADIEKILGGNLLRIVERVCR
jgi:membrane dipeptidase